MIGYSSETKISLENRPVTNNSSVEALFQVFSLLFRDHSVEVQLLVSPQSFQKGSFHHCLVGRLHGSDDLSCPCNSHCIDVYGVLNRLSQFTKHPDFISCLYLVGCNMQLRSYLDQNVMCWSSKLPRKDLGLLDEPTHQSVVKSVSQGNCSYNEVIKGFEGLDFVGKKEIHVKQILMKYH